MIQIQLQGTSLDSSIFMKLSFFYGRQCLSFIFFNLLEKQQTQTVFHVSHIRFAFVSSKFFFLHPNEMKQNSEGVKLEQVRLIGIYFQSTGNV